MATYFHGGSEIQADGLQTLYLMNPNFGYSDHTQQPPNMFFFNSAAGHALNPASVPQAPPQQSQHFMGVPLPLPAAADDQNRHEIPVLHGVAPRFHYNLWGSHDQNSAGNHPHGSSSAAAGNTTVVVPPTPQSRRGLSLSLSPQTRPYGSIHNGHEIHAPATVISPRSDDVSVISTNGISGLQSVIMGSKYLKAAQKLLDEVVSVGKGGPIKNIDSSDETNKEKIKMSTRESTAVIGGEGSSGAQNSSKHGGGGGGELSTAQRQEFQMKKAKLINMLDEVEQRYRQYHNQMQIVATSFEQVAGLGSAKSYTALALQTISKQFRCLKDAITAQIKATSKSLGEEDCTGGKIMEGSRLKFVDQQIRQQRAFQQMGMIQNNAWRPQRGLPERAVSVLRAWLFEHFLHPYPKDSDKHMLAKQTGLSRSQVSNWFINARVRLWKPMVEEMYVEEMKDQEQNGSDQENSSKPEPKNESGSKSTSHQEHGTLQSKAEKPTNPNPTPTEMTNSTFSTSPLERSIPAQPGFSLLGSSDMEWIVQRSPKKPRNPDMDMKTSDASKGSERQIRDAYELITAGTDIHTSGFGGYPMGDLGRFSPEQLGTTTRFLGNGVSLTLGLPHCEQNYISSQNMTTLEMGNVDYNCVNGSNTTHTHPQPSHSSVAFENLNNIPNRKRFAAQLLPDFVA